MNVRFPRRGVLIALTSALVASYALVAVNQASAVPPGTVKLPASKLKRVQGIQCGYMLVKRSPDRELRGRESWVPGTLGRARAFTSHLDNSRYFDQMFKKTKEKRYKGLAASFLARHDREVGKCRGKIRFKSFQQAIGIGTVSSAVQSSSRVNVGSRSRDGGQPLGVTSNVRVLEDDLQVSEVLNSGALRAKWVFAGPNNRVFFWFAGPLDLNSGVTREFADGGCMFAEANQTSGALECVDDGIWYLKSPNWWGTDNGPPPPGGLPTQVLTFDSSGAVYYLAKCYLCQSLSLHRAQDGTSTNLVGPASPDSVSAASPAAFGVTAEGDVLVSGSWGLPGSGVRLISPSGSISSILTSQTSRFFLQMPDGSLRFDLGGRLFGFSHGDSTFEDLNESTQGELWKVFRLSDGRVLAWVGTSIKQFWPTVQPVTTSVASILQVAPVGSDLVIFGRDGSNAPALVKLNLGTGSETSLLGPMTAAVDELTSVYPIPGSRVVLFTGLRYADNTELVGQLNVDTGSVSIQPLSETFETFEAFG